MDMQQRFLPTIRDYSQQSLGYRKLQATHELVDYQPNSSFRIWHNDAVKQYDMHWHSAVELLYAVQGSCSITCNGNHYRVSSGGIFLVPAGKLHAIETSAQCEHFVFLFDMDDVIELKGFTSLMPLMMNPIEIRPDSPIHDHAASLLKQAINAYFNEEAFEELDNYGRILALYALIGREHFTSVKAGASASDGKRQKYFSVIQDVMDYIDLHYMEDLDLDRIASQAGFSKFHFARMFKQYTNTTFHQFLCMKRVDMAERLMASTDLSISKIALQVGFASIPTFSRVYKSLRHYTPTEYKALSNR